MKNTVRYVICLLAVLLVSPAMASEPKPWREDVPCGTMYPEPKEAEVKGCELAFCVEVAAATRVCSCSSQDLSSTEMFFEEEGAIKQRWDGGFTLPSNPSVFRVDSADLSGSGRQDLVVATLNGISNGMGVEYWEVRAIVDDKLLKPLGVEDYGIMGYLTRSSSDGKCRLLVTRWLGGWEPEKGEGLYLMGEWYRYSEFSPELVTEDRPAVYRRYLFSFQRLRGEQLEKDLSHRRPLPWFSDSRAKVLVGPYPEIR